jgi:hypothetical protein
VWSCEIGRSGIQSTQEFGSEGTRKIAVNVSEFSVCDERGSIQVHIAASTRSLWDLAFPAACLQIQELGFDKVEIWLNEDYDQLKPSKVASIRNQLRGCSKKPAA